VFIKVVFTMTHLKMNSAANIPHHSKALTLLPSREEAERVGSSRRSNSTLERVRQERARAAYPTNHLTPAVLLEDKPTQVYLVKPPTPMVERMEAHLITNLNLSTPLMALMIPLVHRPLDHP
jgi:hypothetical protein